VSIRIRTWQGGQLAESADVDELGRIVASKGSRTWIDLTQPSAELVGAVARRLGLHPLIAEDISEKNERAKIEVVGDAIHLVAFVIVRGTGARAEEVDFVLGRGYLLSVHGPAWEPAAAHQLRMGIGTILEKGPDHLLWALSDAIVDGYFPTFDQIADEIELVQDQVLGTPSPEALQHVFRLRRELIRMRHVLAPTREAFAQLTSREFPVVGEATVLYFRDVYDHLIRLNEELDTQRELIAGALDVYLSSVNNTLSAIMKRLTGVTVILAGIGAVGGLFGMSEAAGALSGGVGMGFWIVVAATAIGAVIAWLVLRRINWL
jgi:magnesium transporter